MTFDLGEGPVVVGRSETGSVVFSNRITGERLLEIGPAGVTFKAVQIEKTAGANPVDLVDAVDAADAADVPAETKDTSAPKPSQKSPQQRKPRQSSRKRS